MHIYLNCISHLGPNHFSLPPSSPRSNTHREGSSCGTEHRCAGGFELQRERSSRGTEHRCSKRHHWGWCFGSQGFFFLPVLSGTGRSGAQTRPLISPPLQNDYAFGTCVILVHAHTDTSRTIMCLYFIFVITTHFGIQLRIRFTVGS